MSMHFLEVMQFRKKRHVKQVTQKDLQMSCIKTILVAMLRGAVKCKVFKHHKHLSLKVPNIKFDINALIGKSMLGFRH